MYISISNLKRSLRDDNFFEIIITMRILGIETTCDETGVAIYDSDLGLLDHVLHSQVAIHAPFGGVVPELASRDHIRKTIPLIKQVLEKTHTKKTDLGGIAYAAGPGLIGAVLVGASIGRSLGFALEIPTIGVNHLEAHLLAPMLEEIKPAFPFLNHYSDFMDRDFSLGM